MKSTQKNLIDASSAPHRARRSGLLLMLFAYICLLASLPSAVAAQQPAADRRAARARQQQITQTQADLYERWRSNINLNQQVAFEAGREYVGKYPNDEYAARVSGWVEA